MTLMWLSMHGNNNDVDIDDLIDLDCDSDCNGKNDVVGA